MHGNTSAARSGRSGTISGGGRGRGRKSGKPSHARTFTRQGFQKIIEFWRDHATQSGKKGFKLFARDMAKYLNEKYVPHCQEKTPFEPEAIFVKMTWMAKQFKAVVDKYASTGSGVMALDPATINANKKAPFGYYFDLEPFLALKESSDPSCVVEIGKNRGEIEYVILFRTSPTAREGSGQARVEKPAAREGGDNVVDLCSNSAGDGNEVSAAGNCKKRRRAVSKGGRGRTSRKPCSKKGAGNEAEEGSVVEIPGKDDGEEDDEITPAEGAGTQGRGKRRRVEQVKDVGDRVEGVGPGAAAALRDETGENSLEVGSEAKPNSRVTVLDTIQKSQKESHETFLTQSTKTIESIEKDVEIEAKTLLVSQRNSETRREELQLKKKQHRDAKRLQRIEQYRLLSQHCFANGRVEQGEKYLDKVDKLMEEDEKED